MPPARWRGALIQRAGTMASHEVGASEVETVDDASEAGVLLASLAAELPLRRAEAPSAKSTVAEESPKFLVRRKRGGNCVRPSKQNSHLVLSATGGGETRTTQCVRVH